MQFQNCSLKLYISLISGFTSVMHENSLVHGVLTVLNSCTKEVGTVCKISGM